MVLSFFTLEAYLNHLWQQVFQDKLGDEKVYFANQQKYQGTLGKLDFIIEDSNADLSRGKRPYQTLKCLHQLRRDIVHGRTEQFEKIVPIADDGFPEPFPQALRTFVSQNSASRGLEDTEKAIQEINRAMQKAHPEAEIEDYPLRGFTGFQIGRIPTITEQTGKDVTG